jgi:hypothetical protein
VRLGITWFITVVTVFLASFSIVSASNTNVTFDAGPFNCTIDLGLNCSDININKPIHNELSDGTGYDRFAVNICGVSILLTRYNKSNIFDLEKGVSTDSIFGDLISLSADKKTIQVYKRVIDGQNGAAGSATVPRYNSDVYDASYLISSRSVCRITIWGASNNKVMISAMDTIHVKEAL